MKITQKKRMVVSGVVFVLCGVLNYKYNFWNIPIAKDMVGYQVNLCTISTIFAGFSFTVLGMLITACSDELIKKLKDTNIVTIKSKKIIESIVALGISCLVSLAYITGFEGALEKVFSKIFDDVSIITDILFFLGIGFLLYGIVFFVLSANGVYSLIKKIYGYNKGNYEERKKMFDKNLEKMKLQQKYQENSDDEW